MVAMRVADQSQSEGRMLGGDLSSSPQTCTFSCRAEATPSDIKLGQGNAKSREIVRYGGRDPSTEMRGIASGILESRAGSNIASWSSRMAQTTMPRPFSPPWIDE